MGVIAPNLSYHYWTLGIKPAGKTAPEDPLIMIPGTEFDPGKEIEHEEDKGHTGGASLTMGMDRKKAASSPNFTDKARYQQGLEDMWYLLYGDVTGPVPAIAGATLAKKYTFAVNVADPADPPLCTLHNGYAKTANDAFVYDNCMLNELEVKFKNDEAMTITPSFVGDYPKFKQPNPARVIPTKKVKIRPGQTILYYAPVGVTLTDENKADYAIPCVLEGNVKINNNAESEPCAGDDFGTETKNMGQRESNGGFTVPWTDATKNMEAEYQSGAVDGTTVTEEPLRKQIMIESIGELIETVSEEDVFYSQKILIPDATITKCESPQSGDERKSIDVEYNINDENEASFMTVEIVTELTALHIGTV
jgi:hypothetical protein